MPRAHTLLCHEQRSIDYFDFGVRSNGWLIISSCRISMYTSAYGFSLLNFHFFPLYVIHRVGNIIVGMVFVYSYGLWNYCVCSICTVYSVGNSIIYTTGIHSHRIHTALGDYSMSKLTIEGQMRANGRERARERVHRPGVYNRMRWKMDNEKHVVRAHQCTTSNSFPSNWNCFFVKNTSPAMWNVWIVYADADGWERDERAMPFPINFFLSFEN